MDVGNWNREEARMPNRKSMLKVVWVALLALSFVFPLSAAPAADEPYPSRTVRFVIPFAPGGVTDIIGRVVALKLSERIGKQMVVENRSGAGGTLGIEMVANAKPDGYTLLFTTAAFATNPSLYKVSYDPIKSFVPIAKVGSGPNVLAVHPAVPVNSVMELIALAKKQPGKLACSAAGAGSFGHLAIEHFKAMAGVDFKIVQFKGGGPAVIDTIGGHTQIHFSALTTTQSYIKSGKLKALGISGAARSKLLPDLPTISEAGVPGYEASMWLGLFAPAGTPKAIVDKLNKDLAVTLDSADTEAKLQNQGVDVELMGSSEFGTFLKAEMVKWEKVIREGNIKAEGEK
jgi:tripartite-type tricarboxylate transporter receptor subunit TctC